MTNAIITFLKLKLLFECELYITFQLLLIILMMNEGAKSSIKTRRK